MRVLFTYVLTYILTYAYTFRLNHSIAFLSYLWISKQVQQISRDFQQNAYQVHVGSLELRANVMIKQIIEVFLYIPSSLLI